MSAFALAVPPTASFPAPASIYHGLRSPVFLLFLRLELVGNY